MGAQEGRIFELHPGPNRIFELPPGPNRIFELPPGPNRIIKLPPGPNRIIKLPPGSDSEKPFTMLLKQAVEKANEKRFLEQAPRQLHTLAEENDNLKAQVESLERSQEALQASSSSQQAVVSELTAEVQTLKDALEAAAQREASELKAQVTRFAEGMEAVHASLNSQTAAMVAQQAWLRALAPQAGGISGLQGSDLNSWNLVGQSQPGETGSMAGVSAAGISIESTGPRCFLTDAIFKTPSGLREAIHLHESAVVVAENGTELKVRSEPETHVAHVSLNLQTANARLQITPDHRIVLPDQSTVPAEKLKIGDLVMVEGQPTPLTDVTYILGKVDVVKIAFYPDLPVNVFHKPEGCIASKGHKKHHRVAGHRGGKNRTGRPGNVPAEDFQSIPDTEGYLTE